MFGGYLKFYNYNLTAIKFVIFLQLKKNTSIKWDETMTELIFIIERLYV